MDDHPSWLLRCDTAPPFHSCNANGCCPQLAAYNDNAVAVPFLPQQPGSAPPVPPTSSTDSMPAMYQPSWTWREPVGGSRRVRKRITRACDRCHQVRTKCDGQHPCAHCTNNKVECRYNREQKKRGKAPRKDLINRAASQDTVDSSHCVNAVKLTSATSSPHIKKSDPVAITNVELAQHVPNTSSPSLLPPTVSSTVDLTTSNSSTLGIDTTSISFYPQQHQYDNSIYSPEHIPTFQGSGQNGSNFTGEPGFGSDALWLPNHYHTPHAEQSLTHNQIIPGQLGSDTFQAPMEHAKEVIPMGGYPTHRQDVTSKSTHKENQKNQRIRKVIRRLLAE